MTLTLTLDVQGQILKKSYLRNGMADWHGTKGMWVDRMLGPCCDFQRSRQPRPWPWMFRVKFWKSRISGMGWPIDMERKGCESIECWAHVVTFNVHVNHDPDLGFPRSNLLIAIYRNARAHPHRTKAIWFDRVLYLLCGLQQWLLTLDFPGEILKMLYLRNGRVDSLGIKGMWVGYDVGYTMGLTLGHGTWQIDRSSNG